MRIDRRSHVDRATMPIQNPPFGSDAARRRTLRDKIVPFLQDELSPALPVICESLSLVLRPMERSGNDHVESLLLKPLVYIVELVHERELFDLQDEVDRATRSAVLNLIPLPTFDALVFESILAAPFTLFGRTS